MGLDLGRFPCDLETSVASKNKTKDVVQVKNPKTGKYVKIDRAKGKIIAHKKSDGPYKNVPVARKRTKKD